MARTSLNEECEPKMSELKGQGNKFFSRSFVPLQHRFLKIQRCGLLHCCGDLPFRGNGFRLIFTHGKGILSSFFCKFYGGYVALEMGAIRRPLLI